MLDVKDCKKKKKKKEKNSQVVIWSENVFKDTARSFSMFQ